MGWDQDFLQDAANTCTNPSGEVSDCAMFDLQDSSVYGTCNITMPAELVSDNVVGPMATLPGDDVLFGAATSAQAAIPTLSYSAGISISAGASDVPGGIFKQTTTLPVVTTSTPAPAVVVPTTMLSVASAPPATTPAPALSSAAPAQSYFSTAWATSGGVVEEVLWVADVVTVTKNAPAMTTVVANNKRHAGHAARHRKGL